MFPVPVNKSVDHSVLWKEGGGGQISLEKDYLLLLLYNKVVVVAQCM